MAKQVESNLNQTKSSFKFIGKVSRIDKEGAWNEKTMEKGKMEGKTYRSLRFGLKTSPTNEMTVQMFDFEPEKVFMWNSEKKKADNDYKGDRVPFAVWEEKQEELREEGFAVLQSRIGLTYGEDGKLQTKGLPSYVASREIYDGINNGDSVVAEGTVRHSVYKNREGKEVPQTNYTITKLFKIKDIDFEASDFEEVTYFEQEVVFIGTDIDKKEKKAYITGRSIEYNGNFQDSQFVINLDSEDGEGFDAEMVKLADAFNNKFKFGDVLNVFGDALNRVVLAEVEDDENEEDALLASLGGKKKPKHAQNFVSRTYISEMQITGLDAWDKKVYKEDDFFKETLLEDNKKSSSEFGGKSKPKGSNPFEAKGDAGADIDEDDLPF